MSFAPGRRLIIVSIAGQPRDFGRIFFELRGEIDSEWVFADGSYVRAHQHASGARRGEERAIGKSRGGATTKLHVAADAHGNPIDFEVTGGEVHDAKVAKQLITKIGEAEHLIADKGYDSEAIREQARAAGMNPVIRENPITKKPNPVRFHLYKLRHLVENLFARPNTFEVLQLASEACAQLQSYDLSGMHLHLAQTEMRTRLIYKENFLRL